MILNLFALLFVLGLTSLHSMFGLFSGLINVGCSLIALSVTFGFYDALNNAVTENFHLHSSYSEPAVFVLLFVVTLGVLRFAADNFVRGNVRIPMYVDWGGGAVCGVINAQIAVGVLAIGFLMLPWGGRVAMYQPIERHPENEVDSETGRVVFERHHLWLRSDEFAAGLFNFLSNGSLRGATTFATVYPNFTEWVAWTGNTVQNESLTSPIRDGKVDGWNQAGISVKGWWVLNAALPSERVVYRKDLPNRDNDNPPYTATAYRPASGHVLLGVRAELPPTSSDRDKDVPIHRFRATMIRVVGDVREPDGSLTPQQYCAQAIGGADPKAESSLRLSDPDANFSTPADGQTVIDAYFEVPEGFQPRFIEYRRHARAPLVAAQEQKAAPEEPVIAPLVDQDGQIRRSGLARFIDAVVSIGDEERLPVTLNVAKMEGKVQLSEGRLASVELGSRVTGFVDEIGSGEGGAITQFKIPDGQRIFQLQTRTRRMQSIFGQALNFAAATLNQYKAVDNQNRSYPLAGFFALVQRGGRRYVEFYFTPTPEESGFRGMIEVDSDTRRALREQEDSILGLIFVVPRGTCLTAVESQGGKIEFGSDKCVQR